MSRDFKTGLLLGLVLVIACVVWLATRPQLSVSQRAKRIGDSHTTSRQNTTNEQATTEKVASSSSAATSLSATTETIPRTENSNNKNPPPPDYSAYYQKEKIRTNRFHIVKEDQTLSEIAAKYYGAKSEWKTIYKANKAKIPDPDSIRPGTKLIIPNPD